MIVLATDTMTNIVQNNFDCIRETNCARLFRISRISPMRCVWQDTTMKISEAALSLRLCTTAQRETRLEEKEEVVYIGVLGVIQNPST